MSWRRSHCTRYCGTDMPPDYVSNSNQLHVTFSVFNKRLSSFNNNATDIFCIASRYCGAELPPDYVSISNQLHVTFRSDYSISHSGFRSLINVDAHIQEHDLCHQGLCRMVFETVNIIIPNNQYLNCFGQDGV